MQFVVGLKLKGRSEHIAIEAEDALIAALKAKAQHPYLLSCMSGAKISAAICAIPQRLWLQRCSSCGLSAVARERDAAKLVHDDERRGAIVAKLLPQIMTPARRRAAAAFAKNRVPGQARPRIAMGERAAARRAGPVRRSWDGYCGH